MNRYVNSKPIKYARGLVAVEFAIVATMLFLLIFGIIEFGRFMYVWNTAQEVTRIAAREAVVSNFTAAEQRRIQRMAVFGDGVTENPILPGAAEITADAVNIRYLTNPDTPVSALPASPADNIQECLDDTTRCIRYVEVRLCTRNGRNCNPISYRPMVGLFDFLDIEIPRSTVIMPAESLGYTP